MALLNYVSRFVLVATVAVVSLGLTACGDDERTPADACRESCVVQMSVNCSAEQGKPASDCEAACQAAFTFFPSCKSQTMATLDCAGLKVASGWQCDADGQSEPKPTVCAAEQQAMEACQSQ